MSSRCRVQSTRSGRKTPLSRHPDCTLDRDPAHEPGEREVLAPSAYLPDPLVGLVPVLPDPVHHAREVVPGLVVDGRAVLVVEIDGVDQLAIDVELELLGGPVPDPDRR